MHSRRAYLKPPTTPHRLNFFHLPTTFQRLRRKAAQQLKHKPNTTPASGGSAPPSPHADASLSRLLSGYAARRLRRSLQRRVPHRGTTPPHPPKLTPNTSHKLKPHARLPPYEDSGRSGHLIGTTSPSEADAAVARAVSVPSLHDKQLKFARHAGE